MSNVGYENAPYLFFYFALQLDSTQPLALDARYGLHPNNDIRWEIVGSNEDSIYTNVNAKCKYTRDNQDPYYPVIEGYLEFSRFDTIEKIVAGTFEITAYIDQERSSPLNNCTDTARISKGRFDMIMAR